MRQTRVQRSVCVTTTAARDRLRVGGEGTIWLTLLHRWADGTTHLPFDPLKLLERLAVLTPRAEGQPDSLLRCSGKCR
jgi:hypothetical protein